MDPLVTVAVVIAVAYLLSCLIWPYSKCPWCRGLRTRGDGLGRYRLRSTCWLFGSSRYRRLGARPLGRGDD